VTTFMRDPPGGDAHKALEEERHIMSAYSDTAKTYSQLSLGALVLSVTFFEKVANTAGKIPVETPLVVAWSGWLVCTLAGAFYQYLAVRFLEARGESWGVMTRTGHPQWFRWLANHPWPVYALMLVAFAIGSVAFAIVGFRYLPRSGPPS
jgi:hypothetical protein